MTAHDPKAIVRRYFEEVWNQRKLDVVDDIFAPTFILNGTTANREAFKQGIAARLATFPDIHVTLDDEVAEHDKVSIRRAWQGTHQGTYRGIAATGKRVKWTQISIVRFAQGRAVEAWAVADELSILQQLGESPR